MGNKPKPQKPEAHEPKSSDVMLVHGVSEDGKALAVLRAREDRLEAGIVQAVREGEPITGELVQLKPRADCPLLCDVEVTLPQGTVNARGGSEALTPPRSGARSGPAQVATPRYRDNWEAIWERGGSSAKKDLPN